MRQGAEIAFLSNDEMKIIGDCLSASVDGPFFPEWEFSTLFGLKRAEVAQVRQSWPDVSAEDETTRTAVNNALVNLLGYPHNEELGRFVSATPKRLREILAKWQRIQQYTIDKIKENRDKGPFWGRPVEYTAEFIANYIELLRTEGGPSEGCSPLEEVDPQLLQPYAISEQDEDVRAYLVEVIWEHRRPDSAPFLARMLNDPSKKVWKVALDGLVLLGLPVVEGGLGIDAALVALKAARAGASAERIEYIDEAIDEIEHPKAYIEYLHIKRPYSFTSPFKGADFVALIYAVDENITYEEQEAISDQIVTSGCRYAVCAGYKSSSWDDSIDMADIKRNGGEVRDENLVMTSWHDNESLENIVFFFLNNTSFDYFTAERFVVLFVGGDSECISQVQREIETQLARRNGLDS